MAEYEVGSLCSSYCICVYGTNCYLEIQELRDHCHHSLERSGAVLKQEQGENWYSLGLKGNQAD